MTTARASVIRRMFNSMIDARMQEAERQVAHFRGTRFDAAGRSRSAFKK